MPALLVKHLEGIAAKEGIEVEPEALALIARAAEGSVRDSLSLLDQAIAHAAGPVRAEDVRQMLGLADRTRVIDLFEALMRGDVAAALSELRAQYDTGADPAVVLSDLAEFTHFVTRVKVVPAVADDPSLIEVERTRGRGFAEKLSMRVLSRTWQMLLKGIAEVQAAGRPVAAAEMVLVRIAYAADLPTPDEVIRSLDGNGDAEPRPGQRRRRPRRRARRSPPRRASRHLASRRRGSTRRAAVRAPRSRRRRSRPAIRWCAAPSRRAGAAAGRRRPLRGPDRARGREARPRRSSWRSSATCGWCAARTAGSRSRWSRARRRRWSTICRASSRNGPTGAGWWWSRRSRAQPTVKSQDDARQAELKTGVRADPLVQAVLARFPGAEIVDVRKVEAVPQALPRRAIPTSRCRNLRPMTMVLPSASMALSDDRRL